jgi:hypothetical protein
MKSGSLSLIALTTTIVLTACSSAEQARPAVALQQVEAPRAISGIIVKPKHPVANDAALMKLVNTHLAAPTQVTFLRPMSGGAYVLSVMPPAAKADVVTIITQLTASGLFEYVEEDQMMTTQH